MVVAACALVCQRTMWKMSGTVSAMSEWIHDYGLGLYTENILSFNEHYNQSACIN